MFPRIRSRSGHRQQWLQQINRILPIRAQAKLGSVGPRKEGGESEQRVGSEEAILAGWRRVEQQINIWVLAAKFGQRAGIATAKYPKLTWLALYQRLRDRHDVNVAATRTQQPSGESCVERLADCFKRRSDRSEVAGIALVQGSERMGTGQGAAGADGAKRQVPGRSNGLTQWLEVGGLRSPGKRLGQPRHFFRIGSCHGRVGQPSLRFKQPEQWP